MEKELQKFTEIGREIINFYRKNYWWDCYYIHSDWKNEYNGHIMRVYMADEWNHTGFEYKEVEVSYFSPPKIEFRLGTTKKDIVQHIKELEELFELIKKLVCNSPT